MAGGKLSPRQKMINLMYLVFIAMLAMNMSKQVLSAFGFMNEKLTASNVSAEQQNAATYANLATKAADQPEKYAEHNTNAQKVQALSLDFNAHLEKMKEELTKGVEDPTAYESMDSEDAGNTFFFKGEKPSEQGQAFLDKMNQYRTEVTALLGDKYESIAAKVNTRFDTSEQKTEDGTQPWLNNRYEGFPLITTITNLSQIQADIKTTENEMLMAMVQGQLESDVSMRNYTTILVPENPATLQGANFKGKIVLGKYDATLKPTKVIVNGKEITNIEGGGAVLDFPSGNVGENEIKGEFVFKEGDSLVRLPINTKYAVVAKPNSAVISADKMNVVYRGVQNPITISMPGVPDNSISANAPGLRKASGLGKYMMSPGKGKTVKINVTGKLPDGSSVTSGQTFRIKDIPAPTAAVRGNQYGVIKMPKSSLQKMSISAIIPDFEFDLSIGVSGFSVKVPGSPTVIVKGRKFNAAAIRALSKARKGDMVTIFDVKASLTGNSGYYLKKVNPLNVELTN
ncbi:gliding motility protein GldM [Aureibaculum sp. 2210JD6-5]|uniref:type IX secretion system motor protein PorM/GldM n=1 Tax=Aureibaculum sp. 2210JD6-5 TaxID=3103957 RepID=UPI002AAC64A8|nr:gliding motility protein GldM [Aureibaculum sp. 2210JD6-5]MDY7395350.1 gliding motility protein GldM [Aureibaculum sp. 2210JD6-5]